MENNKRSENIQNSYIEILSSNIAAIQSLAATIRGTVGPKGLDVMLVDQYGDYSCTNDGVEILSKIELSHPAAKLAIEVAKAQESKVGDGTTTATILTDALLTEALYRIRSGISATRLIRGIELGLKSVLDDLKKQAQKIEGIDDENLLALTLISARNEKKIAETVINAASKLLKKNKKHGEDFFIDKSFDFSTLIKAYPGHETKIIDGLFVKKKSHFNYDYKTFKDISVLVIEGAFEPEAVPPESVTTDEGVKKFSNNIQVIRETAKTIAKAGVKAVFVDASMYQNIEEYFVKEGIFVLTQIQKQDLKAIALCSGTKMLTRQNLFNITSAEAVKKLSGKIKKLNLEAELGGISIEGDKFYLPTVLISAETSVLANEKERIAIDAAKAMQAAYRSGFVLGEGIAELNAIRPLDKLIAKSNKEKLYQEDVIAGMEIVKHSLAALFNQIVENAGFDSELMLETILNGQNISLKANKSVAGYDLETGGIINLLEAGILDPLEVKINAFKIASEIACQILKINTVLQARNV